MQDIHNRKIMKKIKYPIWIVAISTINDTPEMAREVSNDKEDSYAREDYKKLFGERHRIEYSVNEPFLGW